MFSYEIICRRCQWRTVSGLDDAIARLRLIGLLRRDPDPPDETVAALLVESAPRMTCPICKEKTLSAATADPPEASDDWQAAVLCEVCRMPVPAERLEAIPNAQQCAKCQGLSETGELPEAEPEFCPHCGALVELRVKRGQGLTRYKRVCTGDPPCRL